MAGSNVIIAIMPRGRTNTSASRLITRRNLSEAKSGLARGPSAFGRIAVRVFRSTSGRTNTMTRSQATQAGNIPSSKVALPMSSGFSSTQRRGRSQSFPASQKFSCQVLTPSFPPDELRGKRSLRFQSAASRSSMRFPPSVASSKLRPQRDPKVNQTSQKESTAAQ